jgi:plastocyanin
LPPSPTPAASSAEVCLAPSASLRISAASIKFDQSCLYAIANAPFTITFDNKDSGIPHNIAIFAGDPATNPSTRVFFRGAIVTGPKTTLYHVTAMPPGRYFFHCDVHPTQMTGTFRVG